MRPPWPSRDDDNGVKVDNDCGGGEQLSKEETPREDLKYQRIYNTGSIPGKKQLFPEKKEQDQQVCLNFPLIFSCIDTPIIENGCNRSGPHSQLQRDVGKKFHGKTLTAYQLLMGAHERPLVNY
jgi:hypothetical protein